MTALFTVEVVKTRVPHHFLSSRLAGSVFGYGGYLAAGQDVLLSPRGASDIFPEVKKQAVTDVGWMMQAWCKTT